jgi:hypothetical protein
LFPCIAISTRTDREPCCKTWPCRVLYLPLPSPVRTSATLLRRHGWAFTGHSCAVLSYLLCHSGCRLKPGKVQLDTGGYSSLWRMSNLHCNKSICSSFHSSNASSSQSQAATACPQMSIASVRAKKSPVTLPIACLPTALCKKALVCALLPSCLLVDATLTLPPKDTARVQSDLCHLSDDSQTTHVVLYTTIIYSVAFFFVVLRLVGKNLSKGISWDDLAVVATLAIVTIPVGLVLDSKYTHIRPSISRCSLCTSGGQRIR